jgi:tyrosine decarboxylase / aspartate 1-decarboxylase
MQLDLDSLDALVTAARKLGAGFANLPAFTPQTPGAARISEVLNETAARLQDNYPYFHPLYAGQMLKPPHPVARLAYALAMFINPNNHALDGGRATSALEKEAVAEIAAMFGWQNFLGQLGPGKKIIASEQAHYTHHRISSVLKLDFESIPVDNHARMDLDALEKRLAAKNDVGTVVVTMGTTATGSVDTLPEILKLRDRYGFRIHADAAYGGYFVLAEGIGEDTRAAFAKISEADSIVIDPHKHGLQPYGCGCVLFRDPSVGHLYKHHSPYTYFSSAELHLGEISLECSRPGAAAAALWATQKLLPLEKGGEFAAGLEESIKAALALFMRVGPQFIPGPAPELDILTFVPRPNRDSESISEVSAESRRIFEAAATKNLHLALAELPVAFFEEQGLPPTVLRDRPTVTALRCVLMKPEHSDWIGQIVDTLLPLASWRYRP